MTRTIADALLRFRVPLLVAVIAGTLFFTPQYQARRYDTSVESMVLQDDPDLADYDRFKSMFGTDELLLIAVRREAGVFDPATLRTIERLRTAAAAVDGVQRASAITSVKGAVADTAADAVVVRRLADPFPETPEACAALRAAVAERPHLIDQLVSKDGKTATVVVRLKLDQTDKQREAVVNALRALALEPDAKALEAIVVGGPVLKVDLARYQAEDIERFSILVSGTMALVLLFALRSIMGTALPLATVLAGMVWVVGLFTITGHSMSIITGILPTLVLVYGITTGIHIFSHYQHTLALHETKHDALRDAVRYTLAPCSMNNITTALGFLSLLTSGIRPVREFGTFGSAGVMIVLALGFIIVPAALAWLPAPSLKTAEGLEHTRLQAWLGALLGFVERHRRGVLAAAVIVTVWAAVGISRIHVETRLVEFFHPDDPVPSGYRVLDTHMAGASPVEVVVEFDDARAVQGGFNDPDMQARLARVQSRLEALPHLGAMLSPLDYLKEMNRAFKGGAAADYVLPGDASLSAQYRLLAEDVEELEELQIDDYRKIRISGRFTVIPSARLVWLLKEMRSILADELGNQPGVRAYVTGSVALYATMVTTLVTSLIESLGSAIVLVSIAMIWAVRSWSLGLLAMIPNIWPILVCMGIMGWTGIELDAATSMIGSIAIGIAVDDTVHILHGYRVQRDAGLEPAAALRRVFHTSGRAIVFTSVVLAMGFWILTTSHFRPTYYFGLLSGLTVVLALVADLVITPALLLVRRREAA